MPARSAALLFVLLAALPAAAQAPAFPTATTIAALTAYPTFYHLKPVVVRGELFVQDGRARLVPAGGVERGLDLLFREGLPSEKRVEVRGQFWDVGRIAQDDPGPAVYDLAGFVRARLGDRWPNQGELLVVNVTSANPVPPPAARPTIRQLALDPDRHDGQMVSVVGQFRGRNILGDLPQAPRVSRTDFVLRHAGGAVWVTGTPPRGRGWALRPDSRMDTDQWLRVEGVLHQGEGLVWIAAKSLTAVESGAAPEERAEPAPVVLPGPPPEVLFTLPADGETDVAPGTTVKIQTSRDLDPASLEQRVKASYLGEGTQPPTPEVSAAFDRGNRVLEVKFAQPLERFRTVRVDLLEGIKGTDGQPMKPFTLTFTVGG
jgi:hypothetical protein